jgi:hemoglobin/transferrin/lactoferrin receptor protein
MAVFRAHDIEQQTIKNIKDLVRHEPGVSVSASGSRFGLCGFTLRGIGGNRVLTQVDRVSVLDAFSFGLFQSAPRNYADLDTIRQLAIVRGPATSLQVNWVTGAALVKPENFP